MSQRFSSHQSAWSGAAVAAPGGHRPRGNPRRDARPSSLAAALALTGLLAAVAGAGPAGAATYTVEPDGSGNFPTIQAAVNAATHGDVILLGDGVFTGSGNHSITFGGKRIAVRSASDDPAACTIDLRGSPTNAVRAFLFTAEGPESVVRGITIANGYTCGS